MANIFQKFLSELVNLPIIFNEKKTEKHDKLVFLPKLNFLLSLCNGWINKNFIRCLKYSHSIKQQLITIHFWCSKPTGFWSQQLPILWYPEGHWTRTPPLILYTVYNVYRHKHKNCTPTSHHPLLYKHRRILRVRIFCHSYYGKE